MEDLTTPSDVQAVPEGNGELTVGGIISNAFKIGYGNFGLIIGATVLWLITIWIPYLNVGTTIALNIALVVALSKGEKFSAGDIFKGSYRKHMGELFILAGLFYIGYYLGLIFLVIPGIVIMYSWFLAFFFWFDKGMKPIEALRASNNATYGYKWKIFWGNLILTLIYCIPIAIFALLFFFEMQVLFWILFAVVTILFLPVDYGQYIYYYKMLSKKSKD